MLTLTNSLVVQFKAVLGVGAFISSVIGQYGDALCVSCVEDAITISSCSLVSLGLISWPVRGSTLLHMYARVSGKEKTVKRKLCIALAAGHVVHGIEGFGRSSKKSQTQTAWATLL